MIDTFGSVARKGQSAVPRPSSAYAAPTVSFSAVFFFGA